MKTIGNILSDNINILVNYTDDIGNKNIFLIPQSSLNEGELTNFNNFKSLIQNRLNAIAVVKAKIINVLLLNNVFFIQGESFPPKSFNTNTLSTTILVTGTSLTQKQVSDNLYAFVLAATGNPLISLTAPFATNTVIINGVTMNYTTISTASGSVLANATQLVIDLFNQ